MIERIGHYSILSELGRGGMGVVYKAHEESLNRTVAIKVLGEHLASDPSYVQRFLREAQSAARLNHPNIVQIHVVGEDQGRHYFVMEYVHGSSLQQLLKSRGSLSVQEGLRLVLQAAAGLAAAHDRGVIHRDIKPANLLIDEHGLVKIADFGLAIMHEAMSRLTATGMFMGTPGYLAPEQCMDEEIDLRADIYSLGVTLFESLTGRAPFSASSPLGLLRQIMEVEPPDVCVLNPQVDEGTRDILGWMMAKDRDRRYSSCHELIATVQPYLDRLVAAGMGLGHGQTPPAVASPVTPLATPHLSMEQVPTVVGGTPVAPMTPPPLPVTPPPRQRPEAPGGRGARIALAALALVVALAAAGTAAFFLLRHDAPSRPPAVVADAVPTPTRTPPPTPVGDLEVDDDLPPTPEASMPGKVAGIVAAATPFATVPPPITATPYRAPTQVPTPTPWPTRPVSQSAAPPRPTATMTPAPFPTPPVSGGSAGPLPVVAAAGPTATPDPLQELVAKLGSGSGVDEQFAAKRLYRNHRDEERCHAIAAEALLDGFNTALDDEAHADAMAWLTNILGESKNPAYAATLQKVAAEAENRKIRRFAEKNLKALR